MIPKSRTCAPCIAAGLVLLLGAHPRTRSVIAQTDSQAAGQAITEETAALNELYYIDAQTGALTALEEETVLSGAKLNVPVAKGQGDVGTKGDRSPVRLHASPKMEFMINVPAAPASLGCGMYRFEIVGGNRIAFFPLKKQKPKFSKSADEPGPLPCDAVRYERSFFKLVPKYQLVPGEYGFFLAIPGSVTVFCFGIDAP